MIILDTVNRSLEIVLDAAPSTEFPFVASYVSVTPTTYVPGTTTGATNGNTVVPVVAAPGASTQRQVKLLTVRNGADASRTLTLQYNDNAITRIIWKGALAVGDTMVYTDGEGFRVIDSTGRVKFVGEQGPMGPVGPFGGDSFAFTFSTDTTDSDPGNGILKFNHATYASVTQLFVDLLDTLATDMTAWLDGLDVSTNPVKGVLKVFSKADPSRWAVYLLTTVTTATGYRKLGVTFVASNAALTATAGDTVLTFAPAGDVGDQGIEGPPGTSGHTIKDEGTPLTTRTGLNFIGAGVTAADDAGGDESEVTIPGYTDAQVTALVVGKYPVWIGAGAMTPRLTNGPSRGFVEMGTNKNTYETLDFDTTTQEFANFAMEVPKAWNRGTITFVPTWTAASGSGTFVAALQAVAISDDDPLDVAFGTEQTSTDTLLAANDRHRGPESSVITVAGSPAIADLLMCQVKRNPADDSLGVDARLLGIWLLFTTDAINDN